MKRLLALMVAAAVALAACGFEVGDVRVGPTPVCGTSSRGMLILMAQAVPEAELIPCVIEMPDGWTIERAEIETDGAELSFDGGRVGDVVVRLLPRCQPVGDPVVNDTAYELEVFEDDSNDVITQHYVFAGGCVTVEAPSRLATAEMTNEISFLSRDGLRRASGLEL